MNCSGDICPVSLKSFVCDTGVRCSLQFLRLDITAAIVLSASSWLSYDILWGGAHLVYQKNNCFKSASQRRHSS